MTGTDSAHRTCHGPVQMNGLLRVPGGRCVRLRRVADAACSQSKEGLSDPHQVRALFLGHMINLLNALLEQTVEVIVIHDTPIVISPGVKIVAPSLVPKDLPLQFEPVSR
jgi:hypothetical protein